MAVVGAKNSAAIAALELYWTGARVTLIHRGAGISDKVKYWIKPEYRKPHQERRDSGLLSLQHCSKFSPIRSAWPRRKAKFRSRTILFSRSWVTARISNFCVLPGSRWSPISAAAHQPANPGKRTPGIYLAGVIVAGMHTNEIFIENGRFHGRQIAEAIAAKLFT